MRASCRRSSAVRCKWRRLYMNEPRKCLDLYKVISQHFPTGTKPKEDNDLLISGQTDSTDRNRLVTSTIPITIHGIGQRSVPGYGIFGRRSGAQVGYISFPPAGDITILTWWRAYVVKGSCEPAVVQLLARSPMPTGQRR
jgi:hypothetical protein